MKRLFLLRHAKSSWDNPSFADFERPLAPRGVRATERLARYMQEAALSFDLVLCSGAERARETWGRIAEAMGSNAPTDYQDALYMAGAQALTANLRGLDPSVNTALLVGHNPDLETLARRLCGGGEAAALARLEAKYPTGGLAEIALDCADWPELKDGCGTLKRFTVPRDLP
jgi:phosphohistidine phosphatase